MTSKKPSKRQVKRTLDMHEEELGQYENVVGMGIVSIDEANQESPGGSEYAIAVYVRKKIPEDELLPEAIIPKYLELNVRDDVIEIPTKVIEQGEVSWESLGKEAL